MTKPNGNDETSGLREPAPAKAGSDALTRPTDNKLFVIGLRCGRLGNRLILFANFIAYAAEYGDRVTNTTFHSYAHLFERPRADVYCRYPVAARRSVFDVVPGVARAIRWSRLFYHVTRASSVLNQRYPLFGRRVVTIREQRGKRMEFMESPEMQDRIRDAKVVFVYGWSFRAPECVARQADVIRGYFRPMAEFERSSDHSLSPLRQRADVVVGVHLRRGDNWKWKGGKYFFPGERYLPWMRDLASQFPGQKVAFLICSDEVRSESEFPGLTVGFGPGTPVGDLSALSKCDYIFGPPSTFSQWASFYGNKPMYHLMDPDLPLKRENFRVADLQRYF